MRHQLKYRGAPFTAEGDQIPKGTAGVGHWICSCGAISTKSWPSGAARRLDHEVHVAEQFVDSLKVLDTPEPVADVTKVVRSSVVAKHVFWTVLGSRAIQYAEGAEGITEVSCDTRSRDVYVTGNPEAVTRVIDTIKAFWKRGERIRAKALGGRADEIAALREWVRESGEPK